MQDSPSKQAQREAVYQKYQKNLKGTPDAYSDTESTHSSENIKYQRPADVRQEVQDSKEVYFSCRDLLL